MGVFGGRRALSCPTMRVRVRVTPRAARPSVAILPDGTFLVKVREVAQDGKANAAVCRALADHFHVPKRAVTIVQGVANRQKLIEISP